jgi:predicted AlkP superfamily pyrophosphatase or phosphodiesterase
MGDALAAPEDAVPAGDTPVPVLPDYRGGCLTSVVPTLLARSGRAAAPWMPPAAEEARQVVLLVLDGLGWHQLQASASFAPTLAGASGGPITSVAPTTTATALTSLTTGSPPAVHGVVGYRVAVGSSAHEPESHPPRSTVLNVLRWRTPAGDARRTVPPESFQPVRPFGGTSVPVVTRSEFAATGFTAAHLTGARLVGWSVPSSLVVAVARLVRAGEPFTYVYYDGLDKVAHEHGLGEHYEQELVAVDRLVSDLASILPTGAVLVITSDHGQVEVGGAVRLLAPELFDGITLLSGEGRFRWLHVRPGAIDDVLSTARAEHGDEAWVCTREEMADAGWFGGALSADAAARLGDVALVAHAPVAFLDPADTGETRLMGRHGSLTAAEMLVPLLAVTAR